METIITAELRTVGGGSLGRRIDIDGPELSKQMCVRPLMLPLSLSRVAAPTLCQTTAPDEVVRGQRETR